MYATFQSCINLVNAPIIPDNVTDMSFTFSDCINLVGDIVVTSRNVASFTDCFYRTDDYLPKTLYCPTGSLTYTMAMSTCDGINGVTVIAI